MSSHLLAYYVLTWLWEHFALGIPSFVIEHLAKYQRLLSNGFLASFGWLHGFGFRK